MSADHPSEHVDETPHAHDAAAEIAHLKEHAFQNIFWFLGFFSLVLLNVTVYECTDYASHLWVILLLAASRALLIAFFMNWLFRDFSLVFRTFAFTVFFFGGMVFLSWWDSTLPHLGNPIPTPPTPGAMTHVP